MAFWDHVNGLGSADCWIWQGPQNNRGYGLCYDTGKPVLAHRQAYQLVNGEIPKHISSHGMCVCHSCDVRLCVNPCHLFLGTHQDNMRDMCKKNRTAHGDNERAVDIARLIKEGLTDEDVAQRVAVSKGTVIKVRLGQNYQHLSFPVSKRPRPDRKVSTEAIARIVKAAHTSGASINAACAELGLNRRTLMRRARRLGIAPLSIAKRVSDAQVLTALDMRKKGATYKDIAAHFGVAQSAIRKRMLRAINGGA
jgi:transposase-like protein